MADNLEETREERIEDLLDRYEDAIESGDPVDTETLCQAHPELIDEVRRRISKLQAIDDRFARVPVVDDDQPPAPSLDMGCTVNDLQFINRGGLGAVYVGSDSKTSRQVAIKFLHRRLSSDPICVERFELESEVTARLEHPGVIPLYGIGKTEGGDPFYAMRFIDGQSMDDLIVDLYKDAEDQWIESDRRHRKLLVAFVSVCKTIAYAHNRGIVHRDIKPANVMLGKYGETIVVDWGLAVPVVRDAMFRQSGEKTLMPVSGDSTSSEQGAGTPAFMSPEQASKLAPTPSSDIYSLGATLYKILCGKVAVRGDTLAELKERVIDGRLEPLESIRPVVPKPLAAIVRKAMGLRPVDRYRTALELAEDVEAYLADEPVSAHTESWYTRFLRLSRRHRSATQTAIVATGIVILLATAGLLRVSWLAHQREEQRLIAVGAEQKANEAAVVAAAMSEKSLRLSAAYLAKSIATEIDLRWRILQAEAASSKLRGFVMEINEELPNAPELEDSALRRYDLSGMQSAIDGLQSWLQTQFIEHQEVVQFESWSVQASDGTQVARVKMGASIGRNYAHRDYFTGIGRDLPIEEAGGRKPLADRIVHMSAVYESTNTRTLKVTFSVPILDKPESPETSSRIGVLSMTLELGDITMDENTWLVDMRVDSFEQKRGLLLQHPMLGPRGGSDALPRLAKDQVDELLPEAKEEPYVTTLVDPLGSSESQGSDRLHAAVERVMVPGRPDDIRDTGWLVVVTEQMATEAE
ncbi:MAG: serine/threonine-protein kinase [Planctomycetota bacterium]